MIKKFLDRFNKKNLGNSSYQHAGKCPKCGLNILEGETQWTCQGLLESCCNFVVPRYTKDGTEITMDKINIYLSVFHNTEMKDTVMSALERCYSSNTIQESNELNSIKDTSKAIIESKTVENQQARNTVENNTVDKVVDNNRNQNTDKINVTTNTSSQSNDAKNTVEVNNTTYNDTNNNGNKQTDSNYNQNKTQDTNTTKKQNQYNNQQNSKEQQRLSILTSSKKRKLESKCSCGGTIYRYGYQVACDNCNFLIGTKYANISFSDTEMAQLIAKRISLYKTFVKKDGTEFKGRVFIDFDVNGNLIPDYKFVNSPKNINGHYKEQLFAPDTADRKNIPVTELLNKNTNSSKTKTSNKTEVGNYEKFNPFEEQSNKKDDYDEYLRMNDDSEPF